MGVKMSTTLIVIIVIVVLLIIYIISMYNKFVALRNRVDNAWSQIDVQLQRRADLIPNLVETVKGYAKHESETLEAVTAARSALNNAGTPEEAMEANNMLTSTLKSLFAVAESYPDLKANTNFLDLQNQLAETEDKVSYMRQSFNDVVMKYNNAIQQFPGNILAGIFHFEKRESFDAAPGSEVAPKVSFS